MEANYQILEREYLKLQRKYIKVCLEKKEQEREYQQQIQTLQADISEAKKKEKIWFESYMKKSEELKKINLED